MGQLPVSDTMTQHAAQWAQFEQLDAIASCQTCPPLGWHQMVANGLYPKVLTLFERSCDSVNCDGKHGCLW
jgi:hypothetical protein